MVKILKIKRITLLEVLLVIGIMAFVGSIVTFSMRRMIQEQSALSEMDQVINTLKTSMDLMMMVNLDSEIRFSKVFDHIQMEILPKSGISPLMTPLIPKKPMVLEHINEVIFIDGVQHIELADQFTLHFLSKGFLMNRGVLVLTSNYVKGSVIFQGYPSALTLIKGDPPEYPSDHAIQDLILKMTEQTRMETSPG